MIYYLWYLCIFRWLRMLMCKERVCEWWIVLRLTTD